jgi:hypothetical protein
MYRESISIKIGLIIKISNREKTKTITVATGAKKYVSDEEKEKDKRTCNSFMQDNKVKSNKNNDIKGKIKKSETKDKIEFEK